MRSAGNVSADNHADHAYLSSVGTNSLGPIITTIGSGTCGVGVEFAGRVTPSNYAGLITLRREKLQGTAYQNATARPDIVSPPGDDTSSTLLLDQFPQSDASMGIVYDLDARGINAAGNDTYRSRTNFRQYAVLGDRLSAKKISSDFLWFAAVSCRVTLFGFGSLTFASDVPTDNAVGPGTTRLTWNLQ